MLKLVQTDNGVFDLEYDPSQDADAAAATLVYAALYTDAEAPSYRVADPWERRGWWADPKAGSGLWHVRRQPLGSAARREALDMARDAIANRDPALTEVQVEEVSHPDPAGNVSSVFLEVTGFHNGRKFIVKAPL